jgi:hypothetical protein
MSTMPGAARSRPWAVVLTAGLLAAFPISARAEEPKPSGPVDFERHVMGLFSRVGCNAGTCHGSFQGKGGLRLSLFGADPAFDHAALTRDLLGRRVNPVDPDRSLLLLKASGQVSHGGGRRFALGSWQHRMFRDWIASGARRQPGKGDVAELILSPAEHALVRPGQTGEVRVRARFADGSVEDVTHLSDFRTQDDGVATVTAPGLVKAGRPGDTALLVSYRGNVGALRVLVPSTLPPGFTYPEVPEHNFIDREVFAKLRKLNMVPSDLASDAEFLRRVTIDTIGSLPSSEEVRVFLADRRADKRQRKIDALLAHPRHAALWATRLCDVTGNNTNAVKAPNARAQVRFSQMWHDWLRKHLAANVPYDKIVRGVLTATSRDGRPLGEWAKDMEKLDAAVEKGFIKSYADKPTLDLFWKVGVKPTLEQYAERTASAFLGIRLECAQCHKHPFDRWTQADYRAYANVFAGVVVGVAPDTAPTLPGAGKKGAPAKRVLPKGASLINEVFLGGKGIGLPPPDYVPVVNEVVVGGKKRKVFLQVPPVLPAKALGGPLIHKEKGKDARAALFDWMRRPDNPHFARSFVNRVWGHYFGVGLVDPVDNFSLANPPSNATLLDALARDFVTHGYDIRRLERTVLCSRVYQLASATNETNRFDRNNYSHSYVRPLLAEVVIDVLGDALGMPEDFGPDAPPGARAIEVGSIRLLDPDLSYALRTFGRPDRRLACDCERSTEASLAQTLYRMADPFLLGKLGDPVPERTKGKPTKAKAAPVKKKGSPPQVETVAKRPAPRLTSLLQRQASDQVVLEELFLATLSRFPTKAERNHFERYRTEQAPPAGAEGKQARREAMFTDALWALLNTREFILNH